MIEAPRIHYHQLLSPVVRPALALWLCITLLGCTTTPEAPRTKILTPEQQSRLLDLQYAALEALDRGHFSAPFNDSAEDIFARMLALNPDSDIAQRGVEQIVEHHIDVALRALAAGQKKSARRALAHARRLDPQHPSIAPTENQLNLLANAQFVRIDLPRGNIQRAPQATEEQLRRLHAQLDGNLRCRFTIAVNSDDQGRFVYQLLKQLLTNAQTAQAPRAAIVISSPNRVEATCF